MILLLDDNIDDLEIVAYGLTKSGIKDFKTFSDSAKFLAAIDGKVIIVIIDHQLSGGKTGLDIMVEVTKNHPMIYAIIVSGNSNPNIILQYMNNDGFRYIIKDEGYINLIVKFIRQAKERIEKIANYFNNNG